MFPFFSTVTQLRLPFFFMLSSQWLGYSLLRLKMPFLKLILVLTQLMGELEVWIYEIFSLSLQESYSQK